jgi:hypothetical protein
MLIEISSTKDCEKMIVPVLKDKGYDHFFRPSVGEDDEPALTL